MGDILRKIVSVRLYRKELSFYLSSFGYKSKCSIENLYPSSNSDISCTQQSNIVKSISSDSKKFSGYIPIEDLDISYSRSSGPGGQHVNKVNTKVTVKFNVDNAKWIPQWIKQKLHEQEKQRITKDGHIIISSEKTRKQLLNQADCMDKIRQMIRSASYTPPPPDPQDEVVKQERLEAARRAMIREKRDISLKKQRRRMESVD